MIRVMIRIRIWIRIRIRIRVTIRVRIPNNKVTHLLSKNWNNRFAPVFGANPNRNPNLNPNPKPNPNPNSNPNLNPNLNSNPNSNPNSIPKSNPITRILTLVRCLKMQIFVWWLLSRLHVSGEYGHRKRNFVKTLPRVESFENTVFLRSCVWMKTKLFKNAYTMVWYRTRDLKWRTDISILFHFCLGCF